MIYVAATDVPKPYIKYDSQNTLTGKTPEDMRRKLSATRREERKGMLSATPRQSPGTAIKPAHSARNYGMAFIGHPTAMSSLAINNPLYECIVPERTFSCPTNMNGRPHFHLIDWLSICAPGATACLLCRWEPGSVSEWSPGFRRECETGQGTESA